MSVVKTLQLGVCVRKVKKQAFDLCLNLGIDRVRGKSVLELFGLRHELLNQGVTVPSVFELVVQLTQMRKDTSRCGRRWGGQRPNTARRPKCDIREKKCDAHKQTTHVFETCERASHQSQYILQSEAF